MRELNFQQAKPIYSKNIQEYEKIFFTTLIRFANNHNQPFVQNACKNFDFSQQQKFAKYFANFSAVNPFRGWLPNKFFLLFVNESKYKKKL